MLKVLEKITKTLRRKNYESSPGKLTFFLTRDKFFGHIDERSTIFSSKSRIDVILKFQPPSNKKTIQ